VDEKNVKKVQETNSDTFILKIKHLDNNTIQGSLQWINTSQIVYFRSLMELIALLSQASGVGEMRSWDSALNILQEVK
jgi:hypothetical protein